MSALQTAKTLLLGGLVSSVLAGCGNPRCDPDVQNTNATGEWVVTAEGNRETCSVASDEAHVELRSTITLSVGQESLGESGPDRLFLREPITVEGGTFEFEGRVEGTCVEFDTREVGPQGDLRLSFRGSFSGEQIRGEFGEVVAGTCPATGDFQVSVSPLLGSRPGTGEPIFNPDASSRVVFRDGGCEPADAGASGEDAGLECRTEQETVTENVYRCFRDSECAAGICSAGICVSACERVSDCDVGEACIRSRCEAQGQGGCSGGGLGLTGLSVMLVALFFLRRRNLQGPAPSN